MMPQRRLQLVLGKFQVKRVVRTPTGYQMGIELPGLGRMTCTVPITADIREGDLLTFYTEVLAKGKTENA